MHLIKDENGNLIQHGHEHAHEHTHEHTHADGVTHSHAHTHESGGEHAHSHGEGCQEHTHEHCGSCQEGDCKKETIALLTYMLQHNEHHAQELDQMAENLDKMGLGASAKAIRDAVADFQKQHASGTCPDTCKRGTEITDIRSGGGTNVSCNCIQRK